MASERDVATMPDSYTPDRESKVLLRAYLRRFCLHMDLSAFHREHYASNCQDA